MGFSQKMALPARDASMIWLACCVAVCVWRREQDVHVGYEPHWPSEEPIFFWSDAPRHAAPSRRKHTLTWSVGEQMSTASTSGLAMRSL